MHGTFIDCNFENAVFQGKICHKLSNWQRVNFHRATLDGLFNNFGECKMQEANFKEATYQGRHSKEERITGTALLSMLDRKLNIPIGFQPDYKPNAPHPSEICDD